MPKAETTTEQKADYFSNYYAKNKENISKRRRQIYHHDTERRTQIRAANAKSYASRAKVKKEQDAKAGRFAGKHYDETTGKELYTITQLAKAINKAPFTVRRYHDDDIIPEASIHNSRGWRLYSQDQVSWLKRIFRECTDMDRNYTDLSCVQARSIKVWNSPYETA